MIYILPSLIRKPLADVVLCSLFRVGTVTHYVFVDDTLECAERPVLTA